RVEVLLLASSHVLLLRRITDKPPRQPKRERPLCGGLSSKRVNLGKQTGRYRPRVCSSLRFHPLLQFLVPHRKLRKLVVPLRLGLCGTSCFSFQLEWVVRVSTMIVKPAVIECPITRQ